MILNLYKISFIKVQWYYLIFLNKSHCLVIFFLKDFCWVKTKGRDGNENSLDLMVILLLFFMNIICFKFYVEICTTFWDLYVLRTWISNLLALLSGCIICVLKHQYMCLLLVLSSITPSLIKCKYNIVLKLEKWFLAEYVMDVLGLVYSPRY
jgi:hypothetical protein